MFNLNATDKYDAQLVFFIIRPVSPTIYVYKKSNAIKRNILSNHVDLCVFGIKRCTLNLLYLTSITRNNYLKLVQLKI